MFLHLLKEENKDLINIAKSLWEEGRVEADSYIIDLDTLFENSQKLLDKGREKNIKLYAMTKQIGRNPYIAKKLVEMGYEGIVAVDYREGEELIKKGVKVSHVGHLVQIPSNKLEFFIKNNVEVITCYTIEKIKEVAKIAIKLGKVQKILLRVVGKDDIIYESQEGGFLLEKLGEVIDEIRKIEGVEVEGLTAFPCILYKNSIPENTNNLLSLSKGKEVLEEKGIKINQLNAPSATCIETLDILSKFGVTHGEPGHSLSGTMPNYLLGKREEKIAITYLSEVSHYYRDKSYAFGGGRYPRGYINKALVFDGSWNEIDVTSPSGDSIDYYFTLEEKMPVGSLVLMAFRTQIFVTRSKVVLVEGIKSGNVNIIGIYDSQGKVLGD